MAYHWLIVVLMWILVMAMGTALVASVVLVLCWQFDHEFQRKFAATHPGWFKAVAYGAFIGGWLFLAQAFESALFFVPRSWGGVDEDGDFVSTRTSIGFTLGFVLTVVIAVWMGKHNELHERNRRLQIERDVLKGKETIARSNPNQIAHMRAEYKARIDTLHQLDYLTEKHQTELDVKVQLLAHL